MQEEPPHEHHKVSPFPAMSKGIQIIKFNEDNSLELNEEVLGELLLHPEMIDRYVCVISIAGAFRMGKSFLLNFLRFYLEVKYGRKVNEQNWLNPMYGKVTGFHFQHGSKPDTEGILIWPEIFLATLEDGTQVAIVLMDTQGAFDGRKSSEEFSTVFALSLIISSVQIYNLKTRIGADDLNNLEYFAGRTTFLGQDFSKFQKLLFLVRDWSYEFEHSFGTRGGEEYLRELFTSEEHSEQTKNVVENLEKMFDNPNSISCFLLPEPGKVVVSSGTFQGDIKDLDYQFVKYVQELSESLLAPEKLILKEYHGKKMTAEGLFEHVKKFTAIFKSGDLPQIKASLFALMQEEYVSRIMEKCETLYENAFTLGRFAPLSEIEEMPLEIAQKFFEQACRNSLADEEFLNSADKLVKSLSLLSFKMKDQHRQTEEQDTEFFENLIKKHIISYENSIRSVYNGEVEFLSVDEFTNQNETATAICTVQFTEETHDFFRKFEVNLSSIDLECPQFLNYVNEMDKLNAGKRDELMTKFYQKMFLSADNLSDENRNKLTIAIRTNRDRFNEQVRILTQEYKTRMEGFAPNVKRFFDQEETFMNTFRATNVTIRTYILGIFDRFSVPTGLEYIRNESREDLAQAIDAEFGRNESGLETFFRFYKWFKFLGRGAAIAAAGTFIAGFAPETGFLAIILRVFSSMYR